MHRKTLIDSSKGFTLVELMLAVIIIGVLAAIAVPRFTEVMAKSKEGTTKGNLGALRSALSIYYSDTAGQFPSDGTSPTHHGNRHRACTTCTANLDVLIDGSYMTDIPDAMLPTTHNSDGHDTLDWVDAATVGPQGQILVTDLGGWAYQWNPSKAYWGTVVVNCTHDDLAGNLWTSF